MANNRLGFDTKHFFSVNLAFQRPAWQKHPYPGGFGDANRAVDGMKTNLSYSGGQCVASNSYPTAEWRVDLGSVSSIHHIVIQYMTGDLPWGIVYL